jgi:protein involved in polysaccharide export with SLBB domain
VYVVPPGDRVIVEFPDGRLFSTTLPVATVHVGWVIVPIVGAVGVTGWALIVAFNETDEVQPEELVTVKL